MKLLPILRSPAIRVPLFFGASGVAFAVGNLLLARMLAPTQYGFVALTVALFQIGIPAGPLGAEIVVNRHRLPATPRMLARGVATSAALGALLVAIGQTIYGIGPVLGALLLVCCVAGGTNWLGAAHFQSQQRFAPSVGLAQGSNWVLLATVAPVAIFPEAGALLPVALLATALTSFAVLGWTRLLREARAEEAQSETLPFPWRESLAILGIQGASLFMVQLDRLIIPVVLSVEDLATYAVLAALVGSPFRVLQEGVPYALLPRLRAAESGAARRQLLARESVLVLAVCIVACLAIWMVLPWVTTELLAGKYAIAGSLAAAALFAGLAKVAGAIAATIVGALGTPRELRSLTTWSWLSVGVAIATGLGLGSFGLTGVVLGVGAGWLFRALAGATLAVRHFRTEGTERGLQTRV